jgi:hypothetical protein
MWPLGLINLFLSRVALTFFPLFFREFRHGGFKKARESMSPGIQNE